MVFMMKNLTYSQAKKEPPKKEHKEKPGKSSALDDYKRKKEEAKQRAKKDAERAEKAKMTHAEVQKNYQEQKDYENTVSNDLPK